MGRRAPRLASLLGRGYMSYRVEHIWGLSNHPRAPRTSTGDNTVKNLRAIMRGPIVCLDQSHGLPRIWNHHGVVSRRLGHNAEPKLVGVATCTPSFAVAVVR